MLRRWTLSALCVMFLAIGCTRPAAPVLQPGDIIRAEVSFAPNAPWPAGAKVAIGMLARVERPGGETHYLNDEDVPLERAVMSARVTFLDGERLLGDALVVPLVHDC
jgi:hypothetical protein